MVMHLRQLFWTPEGWPLVSCQRYAREEEATVAEAELIGEWEQIIMDYQVVPGYADEQISPNFNDSDMIMLEEGGTISGGLGGAWSYAQPWLTINQGGRTQQLRVERGRDWENEEASTILFTGLDDQHVAVWGKKLQ